MPSWLPRLLTCLPTGYGDFRLTGLGRRIEALSLPSDPLSEELAPAIELAVIVAPKDFATVGLAIEGALEHSRNPITTVRMVTPSHSLGEAKLRFQRRFGVDVDIYADEDCLSRKSRSLLESKFAERYHWALQQFLCIWAVMNSSRPSTLVVDADTVLTRDRTFLGNSSQILPVSLEHHEPYFRLVSRLGIAQRVSRHSHVVHHMLQQAKVWKAILARVADGSLEGLVDSVVSLAESNEHSALSVDYELYAQGLLMLAPTEAVEVKWSNLSVTCLNLNQIEQELYCSKGWDEYFSVSFHRHNPEVD